MKKGYKGKDTVDSDYCQYISFKTFFIHEYMRFLSYENSHCTVDKESP